MRVRSAVLRRFEEANTDPSLIDDGVLTFVVAGGGPTGVELCGALSELFTKVLAKDFKNLDVGRARVVLVEMTDHVLGTFSDASQREAQRRARAARRRGAARSLDRVGRRDAGAARRRHRDPDATRSCGPRA